MSDIQHVIAPQTEVISQTEDRLRFARLTPDLIRILRAFWPKVDRALPGILQRFYRHMGQEPEMAAILNGRQSHLVERQRAHWKRLFAGRFDDEYTQSVYRIAACHKRAGLELRWYIAGYQFVLQDLIHLAFTTHRLRPWQAGTVIQAVMSAVLLDIDLAITAYLDELITDSITSVGEAMKQLAGGDLHTRISRPMPASFIQLKQDFNSAAVLLEQTISQVGISAKAIASSSGEFSQVSEDIARRAEQQAASLEQSAAALDQMSATIRSTADNTRRVGEIVRDARSEAEQGGAVAQQAIAAMAQIEKSSGKISDILSMIDEIAFQTNLLALNAGIEAARAGDAGRGFAVVATEVRALAQRSGAAAKEIKSLIADSREQVGNGVRQVGEAGETLKKIAQRVQEADALIGDVVSATQQQAMGVSEITSAVNQLDQVTQGNAAVAEQASASAASLLHEATQLGDLIAFFSKPPASLAAAGPTPTNIYPLKSIAGE